MTHHRTDPLLSLVESYFGSYLRQVRGASPHTIRAYRDGLQLFFSFLAKRKRSKAATLSLDDIKVDHVLAFLDHIESTRENSVSTRNSRLAAVRGLVEHLLRNDITHAAQYQKILAIPAKRGTRRPVSYLEPEEIQVVIDQVKDRDTEYVRDRALILFLYNTGARISEALSVRFNDLRLERPPQVRIVGKGVKERYCPLWRETASLLRRLAERQGKNVDHPLFTNQRGERLTRDGAAYIIAKYVKRAYQEAPHLRRKRITPHILRHSCAVALLQAGVDLTVIRDYLGHTTIATTNHYLASNILAKEKALKAFWDRAGLVPKSTKPWKPSRDLLTFLQSL